MVTDKLKKARVELTLAQAEVLLLAQDGPPAAKEAAARIMQRIGNAQLEIDTAETAANATAGMATRLGQEVAKLLTASAEEQTPKPKPDLPRIRSFLTEAIRKAEANGFGPATPSAPAAEANGQPLPGTHV